MEKNQLSIEYNIAPPDGSTPMVELTLDLL
jgi:hypothetical protein